MVRNLADLTDGRGRQNIADERGQTDAINQYIILKLRRRIEQFGYFSFTVAEASKITSSDSKYRVPTTPVTEFLKSPAPRD